MPSKSLKYSSYLMKILHGIIGSDFTISGEENIPKDQPVMFAANHFTRSETFFIPYLIHKYIGLQTRCLADSSLYKGFLGKFLSKVGTISTKDKNRDRIIIKDLVENNHNWLIYPEGSMVKSKKIEKKNLYISHTPYRTGPVRTGTAVLALKSHLYRRDLIDAYNSNNQELLDYFKKKFDISYDESLLNLNTHLVPVSLTYYPIRPGENKMELFAKKRLEELSPRIAEELQIEGNLLRNAQIDLHFGKAINLADYVKGTRNLIYKIPIIKNETKTNFVIRYFKHKLTTSVMDKVYSNLKVNLDHIFSAVLRHIKLQEVEICDLKRMIYLSAIMISKTNKYRINKSIKEENLLKIFNDEPHKEFDDLFNLAKELGEITQIDDKMVKINKKALFSDHDFHQVRIESTLQVIYNEFSLLESASNIVKRNCKLDLSELRKKVAEDILEYDNEIYEKDYEQYYDVDYSKDKSVGRPYFLSPENVKKNKKKIGVLLCHGYKSSPSEVRALAEFLQNNGYYVYAPRLRGHGTAPINIKFISYRDWVDSFNVGYSYLKNYCDEVVLIGFSTGGLISLLSAAVKKYKVKAVISINSALRLNDIRSKFVPAINLWNDVLAKFKVEKGKFEYIDDVPQYPQFNYSRNYLKGVGELGKLMEECEENLQRIDVPTFVIQAENDPVINPVSGKLIYDKISSKLKKIYKPDFSDHVIINSEGKETVFHAIKDFLSNVN